MTIIEKIKQSVEGATGMQFLYHAAGELNELIARCNSLPVAYSFLIDSGTIDDVNGRYHERVTIAVMFCDKTEFDFNALENEQIIDRMKVKAYKWMQSLRMSNALRVISVNNTQRLYDNTTDVLTGFAVNITIEDIAGVGECELPEVVIDVDKNGSYNVVGIDKVRVNVVPKLEELEITQNGEYLPPTDIAGFSKVNVDVQPILEELTITQNGEYTPQEGVDGFSKVVANVQEITYEADWSNFTPRPSVYMNILDFILGEDVGQLFRVDWFGITLPAQTTNSSCMANKKWLKEFVGNNVVENSFTTASWFANCINLERVEMMKLKRISGSTFRGCTNLKEVHTPSCTIVESTTIFNNCVNLIDITTGDLRVANFVVWSPTNALKSDSQSLLTQEDLDAGFTSNLQKLLYNIREHIAANLSVANRTITFSANLKAAILADTETADAFTNKGWTIA